MHTFAWQAWHYAELTSALLLLGRWNLQHWAGAGGVLWAGWHHRILRRRALGDIDTNFAWQSTLLLLSQCGAYGAGLGVVARLVAFGPVAPLCGSHGT